MLPPSVPQLQLDEEYAAALRRAKECLDGKAKPQGAREEKRSRSG